MKRWRMGVFAVGLLVVAGCTIKFAQRSPWDIQRLEELSDQLEQFRSLARLKAEEADELRRAKGLLDQQWGTSSDVAVGYDERGLVARVVDSVLFDSGKSKLRSGASRVLNHVAQVLNEVPDQPIGVEGHTDNEPIKYSGWTSNDELSLARAQAVSRHLVKQGVSRERITTIGYGESRPISSNEDASGRQKNRRVEIVILPQAAGEAYREEAQQIEEFSVYSK